MITGLLGLLLFIADIVAIVTILQSKAETVAKLLWCLLVLALPVAGLIIWFLAGPRNLAVR
jgi:hypothetical protein